MMLNRADEFRRRAEECRRNAAQVADDVLRGTYLDLARRWRIMAHQTGSLEQKERSKKTSGFWIRLFAIALGRERRNSRAQPAPSDGYRAARQADVCGRPSTLAIFVNTDNCG